MRFHVCGMPHAPTTKEHCSCAYTAKVYKFCQMMHDKGHEVYHYGVEGSNPPCKENVSVLSKAQHSTFFQHDYTKSYYPVQWDASLPYWTICNLTTISAIKSRLQEQDFICIIGGLAQQPIALQLAKYRALVVEYGIGYFGTFAPFRVFESYAHMHHVYGRQSRDPDGNFYDAVIPNYFDISDFEYQPHYGEYFLFMGRMIPRKGIRIAVEATVGHELWLCGQGVTKIEDSKIYTDHDCYEGNHIRHVGYADVERRSNLMRNARAILVPSLYLEPFGGVAVEAQLCGTPAITTDWGAFPETVQHGKTGYRCRTLEQFKWAVNNIKQLDRKYIADRARSKYSLEHVGCMYEEYFSMLLTLWDKGWYQEKERKSLNWLD